MEITINSLGVNGYHFEGCRSGDHRLRHGRHLRGSAQGFRNFGGIRRRSGGRPTWDEGSNIVPKELRKTWKTIKVILIILILIKHTLVWPPNGSSCKRSLRSDGKINRRPRKSRRESCQCSWCRLRHRLRDWVLGKRSWLLRYHRLMPRPGSVIPRFPYSICQTVMQVISKPQERHGGLHPGELDFIIKSQIISTSLIWSLLNKGLRLKLVYTLLLYTHQFNKKHLTEL